WIYELRVVAIDGLPLVLVVLYWWHRVHRAFQQSPAAERSADGAGWFALDLPFNWATLISTAIHRSRATSRLFSRHYARAFGVALLLAVGLTAFEVTNSPAAADPTPPVIAWQRSFAE